MVKSGKAVRRLRFAPALTTTGTRATACRPATATSATRSPTGRRAIRANPPRGYHWVNVNGDFVLAAVATGVIADLLLSN